MQLPFPFRATKVYNYISSLLIPARFTHLRTRDLDLELLQIDRSIPTGLGVRILNFGEDPARGIHVDTEIKLSKKDHVEEK